MIGIDIIRILAYNKRGKDDTGSWTVSLIELSEITGINAKNAKQQGYQDGREIQRKVVTPFASQEEYINHGKQIAESSTRYIATINLYVEGWSEAWKEPVVEVSEPVILHNPNTRFCSCPACMA